MILVALIALAARAAASPTQEARREDGRAEAIRYANALTGVDPDDDEAEDDDDDDTGAADSDDDRETATDDADDSGSDRDDDDRGDGPLVEDDDIRRMIAEGGDVQDDRDPAAAGAVTAELIDAATAPGTIAGDDVSFSAASAGAPESYESWMRHQRPSRWGRVDVGVQWRRRWSEPMQAMSRRYDEVLLVATWRR